MDHNNTSLQTSRKQQISEFFSKPEQLSRFIPYFDGDENKASKFKQTLMMIAMDDKMSKYDIGSIFKCGITCAEIGLNPQQNLGQVYFVPYKGKLQLQIGYKGWITLLERAGKICKTHNVYKGDLFNVTVEGFDEKIQFTPDFESRKESSSKWVEENLRGIVVIIRDIERKVDLVKFVQKDKLTQLKSFSQSAGSSMSPWNDFAIEMYQAKAIKYVISKTSIDEKTALAIEVENKLDVINKGLMEPKPPTPLESQLSGQKYIEPAQETIEENEPQMIESEDNEAVY